jgi:putative lipoprotein
VKWALVVAFTLGGQQKAPADRWFATDKWMHFAASTVVTSIGYGLARESNGHSAALRIGAGASSAVGLTREVYDGRVKGRFSGKDLVWDALGTLAGVAALHAVR